MQKESCRSFFFFLFAWLSIACINEERVLLNGKKVETGSHSPVPYGHRFEESKEYLEEQLHRFDSLWKRNGEIQDVIDYGATLVYLGKYKEAKDVFSNIEKVKPGLYATAANIGTVYELLGNNDSALHWISKSVTIDPSSHHGSEWLHINILKAKIGGTKYVNSKFLINTEFGEELRPINTLDSSSLKKLQEALFYQLNERVSFVKRKDAIVGLLLFELGNITALSEDVTTALRNYDKALEYGYTSETMTKRYRHFLGMQDGLKNEYTETESSQVPAILAARHTTNNKGIIIVCSVLLIGVIIAGVVINKKAVKR